MRVIIERKFIEKMRTECPRCLSLIEGDKDEFNCRTSISQSWYEFVCPVCKRKVEKDNPLSGSIFTMVRYPIDENGNIGEEPIKD